MNLPNSLTTARMVLIIPFVIIMLNATGNGKYLALAIFIIASLTDMLDGQIARKRNLVTNFGKFMDPLADKLLVSAAMICLVSIGRLPAWIVIIIISREFAISGFRLIASDNGIVIAAGWWGKCKTVCQMFMIIFLIADFGGIFTVVEQILIWAALILTIISLVDYIWKNRQVLSMQS
ncbi:MAG: CDP-diacylglycerol--glycerol-3-phosphate 3-phosphatidyltransferase [Eubacteriales bacterium]|nr:CDP-diacylglycerol--glycerol-3-phosphate 3-phosphatidyltransferase [Eubacteriales bacterium]